MQKQEDFRKDTTFINAPYAYGVGYGHYNLDTLKLLANETLELSDAIGYEKGKIQGHILKGTYNSEIGNQDQAIVNFSYGLKLAKEEKKYNLLLRAKSSLATEYIYKEEYAKALKEYLNAIEIAKEVKNDKSLAILYINITVVYSIQKEYEQCIFYLSKAVELNKKVGDDRIIAVTLANLASTLIDIGDLKSADERVNESIPIFEKLQLQEWLKQEKFHEALIWFKKSEEIHKTIGQKRYKIPLYNGMSKVFFALKNFKASEEYALKALKISKEINILDERDEILKTLYELKKVTNNPLSALEYLEEFKIVSDTINSKNNKKELRILKSNLEFEQEKERYILENEKRVAQQKTYFYGALLIILTFLVIIFILRKSNKVQDVLNKKLIDKTEELEKKKTHLQNANKTKSKLFSIIAHDLRSPLVSFKYLFDLFRSESISNNEFKSFIPKLGNNIDNILFTLNNILAWSQTQMDGEYSNPSLNKLRILVDENIELLSKIAEKKSISLNNNIDDNAVTWSDKDQVNVIIRNLISNALKFTSFNGDIVIDAEDNQVEWKICVRDNGIGMNRETLNSIFNDSTHFTTFGTNKEKGTGLGLSLCKDMVLQNGGRIWAESVLNKGSSFFFTLPKKPLVTN